MNKKKKYETKSLAEWNNVVFGSLWRIFVLCAIAKVMLYFVYTPGGTDCSRTDFLAHYVVLCLVMEAIVIITYKIALIFLGEHCPDAILAWISFFAVNAYAFVVVYFYNFASVIMTILLIPIGLASVYRRRSFIILQSITSMLICTVNYKWLMPEGRCVPKETPVLAMVMFAMIIVCMALVVDLLRKATVALDVQGWQDSLTHLYNHEAFYEELEHHMRKYTDKGEVFSVLIADIDNFKKVNDTYGHAYGDEVIREVAITLEKCKGAKDIAARYGGEEFALIMPNRVLSEGVIMGNDIRKKFESCEMESEDGPKHFTISVGVAEYNREYTTASEFFEQADKALYEAKNSGKNKVCCTRVD